MEKREREVKLLLRLGFLEVAGMVEGEFIKLIPEPPHPEAVLEAVLVFPDTVISVAAQCELLDIEECKGVRPVDQYKKPPLPYWIQIEEDLSWDGVALGLGRHGLLKFWREKGKRGLMREEGLALCRHLESPILPIALWGTWGSSPGTREDPSRDYVFCIRPKGSKRVLDWDGPRGVANIKPLLLV